MKTIMLASVISLSSCSHETYRIVPQPILVEKTIEVPTTTMSALSLDWPIRDHEITSRYGWRNDLKRGPVGGGDGIHLGLDMVPKDRTKIHALILAAAPGKVVIVYGRRQHAVFGKCIQIQHDTGLRSADGKPIFLYTFYAHLSEVHVSRGDWVERGEIIGRMGKTGLAEGYHLHYEVTFDPMDFMPDPASQ